MRLSNFLKISGVALIAALLAFSGVFNAQAGPLVQATPEATTPEPTVESQPTDAAAPSAEATRFPACPSMSGNDDSAASTPAELGTDPTIEATPEEGTAFEPGYLGLAGENVENCGTRVTELRSGSPADLAGIKIGDVIVAADGVRERSVDELRLFVIGKHPGDKVELVLRRDDSEVTINVELGRRPPVTPPTVETDITPEATPGN